MWQLNGNMLHKDYDILETANVSRNNKSCA